MLTKSIKDFFKNPAIAIPTVIFSIVTQILFYFTIGKMSVDESMITNELTDPSIALQFLGKFMLLGLVLMLFYLFISPVILSWTNIMCRDVVNGEKPSLADTFKHSFKFYWRMLGAMVLTFLILMGVYIVFIILIAIPLIPLAMSQGTSAGVLAVVLIVLLVFIFILSILFLAICLSPVQPLLVYDNLSVIESISKGFKFGFKKFFPILGAFLLLMAIGLAVTIPLSFIAPVGTFIASAITSYLGIFTIIFTMNLYRDYKNKPDLTPVPPQFGTQDMNYYSPSKLFDNPNNINSEDSSSSTDSNDKKTDEDEPNSKFTI